MINMEIYVNGERVLKIVRLTRAQIEEILLGFAGKGFSLLWFGIGPRIENFIAEILWRIDE